MNSTHRKVQPASGLPKIKGREEDEWRPHEHKKPHPQFQVFHKSKAGRKMNGSYLKRPGLHEVLNGKHK